MKRACVVLLLAALGGTAAGDNPAADAFTAGMTAYESGDYATAVAAFEAAFRIDPRPEVAFTLAQAHRNQYFADKDITHLQRALGLYRHYLAEAPTGRRAAHARLHLETIETILASAPPPAASVTGKPQPTQLLVTSDAPGARASIDGGASSTVPLVVDVAAGTHTVHLEARGYDAADVDALAVAERLVVVPATLHPRPAQLVIRASEAAQITVDGKPADDRSQQSPGTHRIAIVARGHVPVVHDVELGAGTVEQLDVVLVATPRRRAARWTLYGAAGLGGAALVTTGLAFLAQHDAVSLEERLRDGNDIDAYNDAVGRRNTWRAVSIGLATAAGVTAITGGLLWYFDTPRPAERAPTLAPLVGPESVGAAVVGRF